MKTPSLTILVGLVSGICLGGSIGYFRPNSAAANSTSTSTSASSSRSQETTPDEEVQITDSQPLPTLTFEEVLQLQGHQDGLILARYLEDAAIDEIIGLLDVVLAGNTQLEVLRWMIEIRGMEVDPEAMVLWVKSEERPNDYYLNTLFRKWAVIDPHAAFQASLEGTPANREVVLFEMRGEDRDQALAAIKAVNPDAPELAPFERIERDELAGDDIGSQLKSIQAIENPKERADRLNAAVNKWINQDTLAALAWMESQQAFAGMKDLQISAIEKLAMTDPILAQRKAEALPAGRDRAKLEGRMIAQWAKRDTEAAVSWVKDLPKGPRREAIFAAMSESLRDDPTRLFELVKELEINTDQTNSPSTVRFYLPGMSIGEGGETDVLTQSLHQAALELGQESPEQALSILYSLDLLDMNGSQVAEIWAARDPEAAAEWVFEHLGNDTFATEMGPLIFEALAKESPENTAGFLSNHGVIGPENNAITSTLTKNWVVQDTDAAMAWVSNLDDSVQGDLFYGMLTELSDRDPVNALNHLDRLTDVHEQREIISSSTQAWMRSDPEGAMTWLESQADAVPLEGVIESSAETWVLSDPRAASQWINDIAIGQRRDLAIGGLVKALTTKGSPTIDVEAAEDWVQNISDPEVRQRALEHIADAVE